MFDQAAAIEVMLSRVFGSQIAALIAEARVHVHPARIKPNEERLAVILSALDKVESRVDELPVCGLHAFTGKLARILDGLFSDLAETWIDCRVIHICCLRAEDSAGAELLEEIGILRVVDLLEFFLGVEVVEVAKEFVEPVYRG